MRNEYPYLIQGHMYQYDLHWIIENIQNIWKDIDASVELHTIKYADPIQWDITTQYQANTVVVDPKTGTAYISTKPVPSGILLTDTNYWTVVFNFQKVYTDIMKNISKNYEEGKTATVNLKTFDLVWVDDTLYYALHDIRIGDAYVPDTNIKQTTVEDMLTISFRENMLNFAGGNRITTLENDTLTISGDWTATAGDITRDCDNLTVTVNNDVLLDCNKFTGETDSAVFNCKNFTGQVKNIKLSVDNNTFPISFTDKTVDLYTKTVNVLDYGAKGDGITDDTAAIQKAINENAPYYRDEFYIGTEIFFPSGRYIISDSIILPGYIYLVGEGRGNTILYLDANTNKPLIKTKNYDALIVDKHKTWFTTSDVPQNCGIKNMMLFGNLWNNQCEALIQAYGSNITYDNIFLYGFSGWGIYQEYGDQVGEEWVLNYDKSTENIFNNCFFYAGEKGIYQSPRVNDVSYNNIFMGRINDIGFEGNGTAYIKYAHFYDCNRNNTNSYALKFSGQGYYNIVSESMDKKPATLFNGYFQNVILECYGNADLDVQLSGAYCNYNIRVDSKKEKPTSIYTTFGNHNKYNVIHSGKGNIFFSPISNSVVDLISDNDILLGQGGSFTNVSGNAIGKEVTVGAGVSNVWYPEKS